MRRSRRSPRGSGSSSTPVPEPGRVIGLDLGDVRIGVAVSDPDRTLAVPIGTVLAGAPQDLRAIRELVREHGATAVVVGHPLLLTGERGDRAQRAESFADALRAVLDVPVHLQDERLSTVEASRALRAAGRSAREARAVIDASAAAVLLQSWLDRERGR